MTNLRSKFRRLENLKKLVPAFLERQNAEHESRAQAMRGAAFGHAIKLSAIVLRGEPKLDEDLEIAWERCRSKFGITSGLQNGGADQSIQEEYFVQMVLQQLPGETPDHKLQHIFDISPPWLLEFTFDR